MTGGRARSAPAALALAVALAGPAIAGAMPGEEHGGDAGGPAAAVGHRPETAQRTIVSAAFSTFTPQTARVLVGDTVTWRNDSVRKHTVSAADGSFDSARLSAGDVFSHAFHDEGTFAYRCSLHASMVGTVEANAVLLQAPSRAAAPRRPFPLDGRAAAPPGTEVRLEGDTGEGFVPAGRGVVAEDGTFRVPVTPETTGRYRAVVGPAASAPVDVRVTDRRISFTARHTRGGTVTVVARVTPADPGGRVVLQLYLPERFGWWPTRNTVLDRTSRATFRLPLHRRVAARAVLTLPDRATPLAISAVRRIGRPARVGPGRAPSPGRGPSGAHAHP